MSVQTATPAASEAHPVVEDGEDLIVSLPPEAPEDEVTQQQGEPVAAKPVEPVAPAQGLEDLQRQLKDKDESERRATEEARRVAEENRRLAAINADHQRRGATAEEALIETQLTVAQSEIDAAKRDYKVAFESGEADKMADAQERIGQVAAHKYALEREKQFQAARREQAQHAPPPAAASGDPIERAITTNFEPVTQTWLRSHKDVFRSDGSLKRTAIDAHETAMDEGLRGGTPEYFARLEQLLGKKAPPVAAVEVVPPAKPQGRPPSVAAPVVRSAPSAPGQVVNGAFRLTPKMRALAQDAGAPDTISYADWVREYQRGIASGEIQPIEG